MKKSMSFLLSLVSVVFFVTACTNTPKEHKAETNMKEHKGEVAIKDAAKGDEGMADTLTHQAFTLDVATVTAMDTAENAYRIRYYQPENDTVKMHGAIYGSKANYTKAAYQWLDDTTVSIILIDEKLNKADTIKVFGNGGRNGMVGNK